MIFSHAVQLVDIHWEYVSHFAIVDSMKMISSIWLKISTSHNEKDRELILWLFLFPSSFISLPETNPVKLNGWKMIVSFWPIFTDSPLLLSGRVTFYSNPEDESCSLGQPISPLSKRPVFGDNEPRWGHRFNRSTSSTFRADATLGLEVRGTQKMKGFCCHVWYLHMNCSHFGFFFGYSWRCVHSIVFYSFLSRFDFGIGT